MAFEEEDGNNQDFMQNFFSAFSGDPSQKKEDVQFHMKSLLKRKVMLML